MVIRITAAAHGGGHDYLIVGSHEYNGNTHTISQGGANIVTLNTAGIASYNAQVQRIARGDYVVVDG